MPGATVVDRNENVRSFPFGVFPAVPQLVNGRKPVNAEQPQEDRMSVENPSRSELRTMLTKAQEGLRVAKEILGGIEVILNHQERGSLQYNVALFCSNAARKARDQQLIAIDRLKQRRKVIGTYAKKRKRIERSLDGPVMSQ